MERKLFHIGDIVVDTETPWTGPMQVIEVNYLYKFYRLKTLKHTKKTFVRKFNDRCLKLDKKRNS